MQALLVYSVDPRPKVRKLAQSGAVQVTQAACGTQWWWVFRREAQGCCCATFECVSPVFFVFVVLLFFFLLFMFRSSCLFVNGM
jgi:hypothetical protein